MATRHQRLALRSRRLETLALGALAVFAVVFTALLPDPGDPSGPSPYGSPQRSAPARDDARPDVRGAAEPLPRSTPLRVRVAGTGIDAAVRPAVRPPDGGPPTLPPGGGDMRVAWDRGGAAPGQAGSAVLAGERESAGGPAALAGLGGVRPGTPVRVDRADGRTVRFEVERVAEYPAGRFPRRQVRAAGASARLHLVGPATGGGTGIVVSARLVRGG